MKKILLLGLILISFVTTSYPVARRGMNRLIFGSTTGRDIIVRDFEIQPSGNLRYIREVVATSPGAVGNIGAGYLTRNDRFNLLHNYQDSNDEINWRNIEFDFDTFTQIRATEVAGNWGGYTGGTFEARAGVTRGRYFSVEPDNDVAGRKTKNNSGKPFGSPYQIFNNDSEFFPVGVAVDPGGDFAAQLTFQLSTSSFFGDFLSLKSNGKPNNDLKRYRFNSDTINISLGLRYDRQGTDTYTAGTRDVVFDGKYKTSLRVNLFDNEHNVLDSKVISNSKTISEANLNAAAFDSIDIYSFGDRRWFFGAVPVSGNKLITQVWGFDPGTLNTFNKQTVIDKQDLNRWNSDFTYGHYTIGFYYEDDDY